ncbi:MAG: cupin domain-containing protein [Actinomycetota bacterium]|nr:cupin domain-containing protein [Actinomycetota bacterium]MDH5224429.1 cupin domain-containing protein [Actinomycetota bacterium]
MEARRKRSVGVGLVALGLAVIVAVAGAQLVAATPSTGGAASTLLAQGATRSAATARVPNHTDVVMVQNTFPPGSSSGWHSHPGFTVVVVQSGEITLYREAVDGGRCRVKTYEAGDTFYEWRRDAQNGINEGSAAAQLFVTFFKVPPGGSARIDRPDPGNCPA